MIRVDSFDSWTKKQSANGANPDCSITPLFRLAPGSDTFSLAVVTITVTSLV